MHQTGTKPMRQPNLLVTLEADARARGVIAAAIGSAAQILYLSDVPVSDRAAALSAANVVLARHTGKELAADEHAHLANAQLIQFVTAGVDYIPLGQLPPAVPIASNGGAYSEPMAEHAVAMAFAAAKRLLVEHGNLKRGEFNQFRPNRMLAGSVCGILGFGGIGIATARSMRALGLHVHAINRSGTTSEPVTWIGRESDLDTLLKSSDVLVLSLPLTPKSNRRIGARELALMKPDAILINLARGEIVDEAALYAHVKATPTFTACIDAWWIEPVRHNTFRMDHPFLDLPNVIGSPHNSASVRAWRDIALRRASENARRVCQGEAPRYLVPPADRMM